MNMRNLKYFSFGIISLIFASCIEEKNLSIQNEEDMENAELGLSTDFSLKTERSISITATDGEGKTQKGVKMGIFASQPYTGEGIISVEPIFVGYTDASGKLNADVVVANNLSKVFVAPLTAGYGQVQEVDVRNVSSLNFRGVAFPQAATVTRAAADEIPQIFGPISGLYQLFIPYKNDEVNENGIPVQGGCSLVSKEQLSPALINKIDSWYPEKKNVQTADLSKNSDLRIVDEDGAQVWVTYVGDGGFCVDNQTVYNSLLYYNYKEGDLKSDVYKLHMTMLLPNTNQLQCPSGLKVQLLYWDGSKYSKVFPNGTRIGFAVARAGFKKDGTAITDKLAYSFKNTMSPAVNGDVNGMYYSTPELNTWGKTQAVTRELDGYNCCVTGFDIRPFGDRKADYDLNDFVVNYTYSVYKNVDNKINGIQMRFRPIAKGAASYTKIGFGIELPLASNDIDVAEVEGAILESGDSNATFIIWEDISKPFAGGETGFINTEKGSSFVSAEELVVTIPLKAVTSNVSMMKFNPFIFVNKRSHEIHLTDFAPTSKMDMNLLGNGKDCSDVSKGIYFRMKDMYCWALDFPRTSADEAAWRYPKEKSSVVKAYKNYNKWVTNKTDLSWFDSTIPGNVDGSELY